MWNVGSWAWTSFTLRTHGKSQTYRGNTFMEDTPSRSTCALSIAGVESVLLAQHLTIKALSSSFAGIAHMFKFTNRLEQSNVPPYVQTPHMCLTENISPLVGTFCTETEIDCNFSVVEWYAAYQGNVAHMWMVCTRLSFLLPRTQEPGNEANVPSVVLADVYIFAASYA